jgi:hypothetical protein
LLLATRHRRLHFLCDNFLFLTVGDLLGGGCDSFLFQLLGFGVGAQIFVGCCCAGGDGGRSYIRA